MIKKCVPKGELNKNLHTTKTGRGHYCEFCDSSEAWPNEQGVNTCKKCENLMLILKCPVCSLDLAIHEGGFRNQRYWCVVHGGFISEELRQDTKNDKDGKLKEYWKMENIKKRREKAQKLNDDFYGTTTEEFKLVNLAIDYLDRIEEINACSEFDEIFKGKHKIMTLMEKLKELKINFQDLLKNIKHKKDI